MFQKDLKALLGQAYMDLKELVQSSIIVTEERTQCQADVFESSGEDKEQLTIDYCN